MVIRNITTVRAIQGAVLATGAPIGWFCLQWIVGRDPFASPYNDSLVYWYMLLASVFIFGCFGFYVGSREEKLNTLAFQDSLTGLPNTRFFHQRLHEDFSRHLRTGGPLSLIHIDIDHFKWVNDKHGHRVGDKLLIAVARTLSEHTREGEVIARVGGEEFCVILFECDRKKAILAANRLRNALKANPMKTGKTKLAITASFGVASTEHMRRTAWELYIAADKAMYLAKKNGRDCIEWERHEEAVPDVEEIAD